jgi:membrane protease YdiL (CAAX protease family)
MKKLFSDRPISSFIVLTFAVTFVFGFLPVFVDLPKDLFTGFIFISSAGPLLAAYIITVTNSKAAFKIGSIPVFSIVFLTAGSFLLLWIYFSDKGLSKLNNNMPTLNEMSTAGFIVIAVLVFIIAFVSSNALNHKLKENYLRSLIFRKEKLKWYLIGLFLIPGLAVLSFVIGKAFGLETSKHAFNPNLLWLISFVCSFFLAGLNEETGWRGFLQKELQKKYNPLGTSAVICVLWTFWHLPIYYNGLRSTEGILEIIPHLIYLAPITVIFTWLYNKSGYSILSVIFLHIMNNNFDALFGQSETSMFALLVLFSIYCIFDNKMWKMKSCQAMANGQTAQ